MIPDLVEPDQAFHRRIWLALSNIESFDPKYNGGAMAGKGQL